MFPAILYCNFLQLFRFLRATFYCNFLSSIAQHLSVNKKDTSKLFKLVLIFFDCMNEKELYDGLAASQFYL